MIIVMIENVSEWEKLRERFKIDKAETFFTFLGKDEGSEEGKGLSWFIKEGTRYAVKSPKPVYPESVRAKVHDS